MDQRLYRVYGRRPHRITLNEVPELALGLLAFIRKQATIDRIAINNVGCLHILSPTAGVDIIVRSDDWYKLVPYLKDGTLDTTELPVAEVCVLHPNIRFDASVLSANDLELYGRILTLLQRLFPTRFPTSNL